MNHETTETMKHVGDAASAFVVVGAIVNWLPPVAALLTIIWTLIRIFESATVQAIVRRFRS
jgi:hypothetical protein